MSINQTTVERSSPAIHWRNLIGAIAAIVVFGLALGEMFPLLSLIMERDGFSSNMIGFNAAMQPLGILSSGFIVPPLVRRFGVRGILLGGAVAAALILLAYPFAPILWAWFPIRFFHGMVVSTLFSVSEAMIIQSADGKYRGRIVALYSSVLAVSFGAGPALLHLTGISGVLPFAVGAAVLLSATMPMLLIQPVTGPDDDAHGVGFVAFARKAPVLLLAIFAFAVFDAAVLSFLPVYGVKKGLDRDAAALLLTVLVWGNVVLQLPIGWLADRVRKRSVMIGCAVVTALVTPLLPVSFGTPWMWVVLIIIGTAPAGLYSVALAEIGERFSGPDLVAGTSALSTMWGLGALIGVLMTGQVFEVYGPDGMPYALTLVFVLLLVAIFVRERWKRSHAAV